MIKLCLSCFFVSSTSPNMSPMQFNVFSRFAAWPIFATFRSVFSLYSRLPCVAICPLLGLISWNLTTRCLAVTGGGSDGECGTSSQPSWLLGALYYYCYSYVICFLLCIVLLCQLACFIITVYVGQLLVHFVPGCPVQLPYVK